MSFYASRPWLQTVAGDLRWTRSIPETTTLRLFHDAVRAHPQRAAILYYGRRFSWAEVDELTDAFAAYLMEHGFTRGDRLGLYLQNSPHFYIALYGAWKVGAVVVPLNPMYRDELKHLLSDAEISALVVSAEAYEDRVAPYTTGLNIVVTCNDKDYQQTDDPRVFGNFQDTYDTGRPDFVSVLENYRGRSALDPQLAAEDPALIAYTSGTSGRAKGAVLTHRNLSVNAQRMRIVEDFDETSTIFTLSPIFHIQGLAGLLSATACGSPLSMNYRFHPAVSLELFASDRPVYMAAPVTAFMAMVNQENFKVDSLSSFRTLVSGGAPLPAAFVERFEERTGFYITQGYGLTETTGPCIFVPQNFRAPVDESSGNLSCGLPLGNAMVRIVDERGHEVPPGETGEILVSGPMVTQEYLNNPTATDESLPGGELRTGDIGFMNPQGWVFVIDRKKDMINASGFKVWPREIEDVLYCHPDIREVAVVGETDDYRGENVVAYVGLYGSRELTAGEVIQYCRERLASYKVPRKVYFVKELPKTASGKIRRREVRETGDELRLHAGE